MTDFICTTCGTDGAPRSITPGSFFVELVLWLCLLVPGLLYSLWRISARYKGCRACGGRALVPRYSPIGRRAAEQR